MNEVTAPGVSFVVTVYNKEPFIPGMIASLVGQTGLDGVEYIFVDDGSTDSSLEILRRETVALRNVRIITQSNAGPSIATNVGVKAAGNPYVKLLDADDLLVCNATVWLLACALEYDADIVIGKLGTYRVGEETAASQTLVDGARHLIHDPLMTVIMSGTANTSGTLFRREAFLAAGGCDESVFIQDFSFFLRMAASGARLVVADVTTALIPEIAEKRVSSMTGQALHDMNRAIWNLVRTDRLGTSRYKIAAMRRAARRTWKWSRRHRQSSILSMPFLLNLVSRLPLPVLAGWVLERSCKPYRLNPNLRFMD